MGYDHDDVYDLTVCDKSLLSRSEFEIRSHAEAAE